MLNEVYIKLMSKIKTYPDKEDALQTAMEQILGGKTGKKQILNIEAYLNRSCYLILLREKQYARNYKTHVEYVDTSFISECCHTNEKLKDDNDLYNLIDRLPTKQKNVMKQYMNGISMKQMPGNYETNRAHYRHALLKIREWVNNEAN